MKLVGPLGPQWVKGTPLQREAESAFKGKDKEGQDCANCRTHFYKVPLAEEIISEAFGRRMVQGFLAATCVFGKRCCQLGFLH